MTNNMTTGAPLSRVLAFCAPLLAGNLLQQFYNLADSVLVGRILGVEAFAAVGSTGALNFLILGFALGLCSGFAIPIAQSYGAGDEQAVRDRTGQVIWLGALFALLITAACALWTDDLLRLTRTPAEIYAEAYRYIRIVFLGVGATMLYNLTSSVLRALGDSRTPLLFLIAAVAVNVALDVLLMQGLGMGVEGAAWATVLSQAAAGLACLRHIRRRVPALRLSRDNLRPDRKRMRMIAGIGVPMGLQFFITAIGSVLVQSAVNELGTGAVAAVSAGTRISNVVTAPLESAGIAMATYCGQNLGARRLDRIREGLRAMTAASFLYCALAYLFNRYAGVWAAGLFLDGADGAVLSAAETYLRMMGAAYPLLALIFLFRNALQGMGFSAEAMGAGAAELAARALIAFGLVRSLGFQAICLANPLAWLFADAILLPLYGVEMRRLEQFWQQGKRWRIRARRIRARRRHA